jgi:hypothetical protein
MQYWDPSRRKGVLYAFRGTVESEKIHAFPLSGLNSDARYRLKFYDHSSPDRSATGRELMGDGLKVMLPLQNSSELVFIEEQTH